MKNIFLKNIVDAIRLSISKFFRNYSNKRAFKRRDELWVEFPYLLGIDLVNKSNLDIDYTHLKNLEKLIKSIYDDVKSSQELKSQIDRLIKIYNDYYGYMPSSTVDDYHEKSKILRSVYELEVLKTIRPIVDSILQTDKYKNFEDMVVGEIHKGVKGLTREQYQSIKERFLSVLYYRVADYVSYRHLSPTVPYGIGIATS